MIYNKINEQLLKHLTLKIKLNFTSRKDVKPFVTTDIFLKEIIYTSHSIPIKLSVQKLLIKVS